MDSSERLNPCPNPECAGYPTHPDKYRVHSYPVVVKCGSCDLSGPVAGSLSEAARLWNLLPRIEQPRTQWVSVEAALPKTEGRYVCSLTTGETDMRDFATVEGWDYPIFSMEVSHWLDNLPSIEQGES